MQIIFENKKLHKPKISVILLDWMCRESFHIFRYLNHQTVRRDEYEIIWIEYYSRKPAEIETALQESIASNQPPIVDQWIVLGMPENIYYHKHLMYNIGITTSKGEIIVICDSDAIVQPAFVESIIKAFEEDKNIVLHLDEVRNVNRRFYPFNFPSLEEIVGEGCINFKNGKTTGLVDREDPLHTRNYGACMCALRQDLIDVGGADEHIHFLGHICGPYDLTFRLANAGKKEVWHENEFLYHVWHPGTDGIDNYLGPHDGKNMSTTALRTKQTGRILPLAENPAVHMLRLHSDDIAYVSPLSLVIPILDLKHWIRMPQKIISKITLPSFRAKFLLYMDLLWILIKQTIHKIIHYSGNKATMKRSFLLKLQLVITFLGRMWQNNLYTVEACGKALERLQNNESKSVSIYGTESVARILYQCAKGLSFEVDYFYDFDSRRKKFMGHKVLREWDDRKKGEKIIVAYLGDVSEKVETLKQIGFFEEDIVTIQ